MRYEATRDYNCPDDSGWRVEMISDDGDSCNVALFCGLTARSLAEEYAEFKAAQVEEAVA